MLWTPLKWALRSGGNLQNSDIRGFGDSSFARRDEEKSQYGLVIGLTHAAARVIEGAYSLLFLAIFLSGVVRRVARSTLSAEGYAISETQETCEWLRLLLADLVGRPASTLREVEAIAEERSMLVVTDSQNLADTVHAVSGGVADKRFRIVVAQIREGVRKIKKTNLVWQNTRKMLADGMTKNVNPGSGVRYGSEALRAAMESKDFTPQLGRLGRLAAIAAQKASRAANVAKRTLSTPLGEVLALVSFGRRATGEPFAGQFWPAASADFGEDTGPVETTISPMVLASASLVALAIILLTCLGICCHWRIERFHLHLPRISLEMGPRFGQQGSAEEEEFPVFEEDYDAGVEDAELEQPFFDAEEDSDDDGRGLRLRRPTAEATMPRTLTRAEADQEQLLRALGQPSPEQFNRMVEAARQQEAARVPTADAQRICPGVCQWRAEICTVQCSLPFGHGAQDDVHVCQPCWDDNEVTRPTGIILREHRDPRRVRRIPARQVADVQQQISVTYSALRGVAKPRFQDQAVWPYDMWRFATRNAPGRSRAETQERGVQSQCTWSLEKGRFVYLG